MQSFAEHAEGLVADVLAPVGFALDPFCELVLERAEREELVGGVFENGGRAVPATSDVDQVRRIEGPATVFALVTPGRVVIAVRAGADDKPI